MYSINRETEVASLNEKLLVDRSETQVSQKVQRSASKKEIVQRSSTMANRAAINDPRPKSTKFNDVTDQRTVVENFLSQPLQFKFNRDQTRIIVMRNNEPTNKEQQQPIQTWIEVYSLPEFKLLEVSELQEDLRSGYKYLDLSDDERFFLYGHEGKIILQTTNSLMPAAYPGIIKLAYQIKEIALPI